MARPYILSSAKPHNLFGRFLQQNKAFVGFSRKHATTYFVLNKNNNCSFNSLSFSTQAGRKVNRTTSIIGFVSRGNFTTKATSVSQAGSFDAPLMQQMENKIKEQLSAELVTVKDVNGDGRHVCIDVIAESFEGQSAMNRQRMVYKAIWEELQSVVHAVDQMTTKTPGEAAAQK